MVVGRVQANGADIRITVTRDGRVSRGLGQCNEKQQVALAQSGDLRIQLRAVI